MKTATSELLLLDVNVLVALAWPNHQFHEAATSRLDKRQTRWATCAITQLGFIRLSSNPVVVGEARLPAEALALLRAMTRDPQHVYLDLLPSVADVDIAAGFDGLLGHSQVTDGYLLALARKQAATFVTFDVRMRHLSRNAGDVEILGLPVL